MENKELKCCPFCGSDKIVLLHKGNSQTRTRSVTVKCKKCICKRETGAIRFSLEWCEKQAIAAWNTRQPDTELAALKGFAHAVISDCWNFTLDAGEIQDLAEQLGLIVPHTVTTDEADGDYGVGDTMYQFSDIFKENK